MLFITRVVITITKDAFVYDTAVCIFCTIHCNVLWAVGSLLVIGEFVLLSFGLLHGLTGLPSPLASLVL